MNRAILKHPNPNVGLVSVLVGETHDDGMVTGIFASYQTIRGKPVTAEEIREIERRT